MIKCPGFFLLAGCATQPESQVVPRTAVGGTHPTVAATTTGIPVAATTAPASNPGSSTGGDFLTQTPPSPRQDVPVAKPGQFSTAHVWIDGCRTWRNERCEWMAAGARRRIPPLRAPINVRNTNIAETGPAPELPGVKVRNTNNLMRPYIHPQLRLLLALAGGLEFAARELAKEARKRADARKPRSGRGATLRPSAETPLWNALVALIKPRLSRRGDRALLARELGVHRARIGEYFDQKTAMPDAERAFQILIWIARTGGQSRSGVKQK